MMRSKAGCDMKAMSGKIDEAGGLAVKYNRGFMDG